MPRGELEVVEFVPRQPILDAVPPDHSCNSEDLWSRLRLQHRTLTSCVAALAALALHLLFVVPVLLGSGSSRDRQKMYRGNEAMQWVVLADSSSQSAMPTPHSPAAPTLMLISVNEALPALPSSVWPAPVPDSNSADHDGQSGLGVLYGRYLGQIQARIERAWLRPRTAIGAPIFQCQVQVDQDSAGRVQEITLLECNGDTRWQVSLVQAIEAASPLPAPPSPALFVHHVLLAFRAMAYAAGASIQLYAPPPNVAPGNHEAAGRDASSQDALQTLREAARAQKPHVVELQIEGSTVEVEPEHQ